MWGIPLPAVVAVLVVTVAYLLHAVIGLAHAVDELKERVDYATHKASQLAWRADMEDIAKRKAERASHGEPP